MLRVTNLKEQYIPLIANDKVIKICFDFEPFYDYDEDGNKIETNVGTWTKHTFMTKRSHSQIKDFILSEMNKRIDEKIVSGFIWNEMPVWLSTENQFNYKAAYDLAVQTGGANLPLVFKFGSTVRTSGCFDADFGLTERTNLCSRCCRCCRYFFFLGCFT